MRPLGEGDHNADRIVLFRVSRGQSGLFTTECNFLFSDATRRQSEVLQSRFWIVGLELSPSWSHDDAHILQVALTQISYQIIEKILQPSLQKSLDAVWNIMQ